MFRRTTSGVLSSSSNRRKHHSVAGSTLLVRGSAGRSFIEVAFYNRGRI